MNEKNRMTMNQAVLQRWEGKRYSRIKSNSDKLVILSEFLLDLGGGTDPNIIKWLQKEEGMGFNCSSLEKESDDNVRINLDYFPGFGDLVIPLQNLISIVEKWMELTEAGVEKIILTEEDDGSFTIKEG